MQPHELPKAGSAAYWLRFAEGDLVLARRQPSEEVLLELLCFHAQQAVEKAIKAVLLHFAEQVPRTHSIEALVKIAAKHIEIPDAVEESTELTLYASDTRYPGNYEPVDNVDYLDALNKAEKVVLWAKSICEKV
jgi:HEPN domain-containing protein